LDDLEVSLNTPKINFKVNYPFNPKVKVSLFNLSFFINYHDQLFSQHYFFFKLSLCEKIEDEDITSKISSPFPELSFN